MMLHSNEKFEDGRGGENEAPPSCVIGSTTTGSNDHSSKTASAATTYEKYASTLPSPPRAKARDHSMATTPTMTRKSKRDIFADSFVVDNRVRTPLCPMVPPPSSQPFQFVPKHQLENLVPPSTTSTSRMNHGNAKSTATFPTNLQPTKTSRWESLDGTPIDSDTLLPIHLSSSSSDHESLVTSATAPAPLVQLAQHQPLDLAPAITTSPAFEIEEDDDDDDNDDDDSSAMEARHDPFRRIGRRPPSLQATGHVQSSDAAAKFDLISTKSSKSVLFGEDLISVGTTSRMSQSPSDMIWRHHNHGRKNVFNNSNNNGQADAERYSYSPCSDFHDVELQAEGGNNEILDDLPVIGGPVDENNKRSKFKIDKSKVLRAPPVMVSKMIHHVGAWTQKEIAPIARTASLKAKRIIHKHRPPPSPRTKNMSDLNYLRDVHRAKVDRLSNIEHENHFDFALLLTPQEVYSYWADLLDFRVEQLGEEAVQAMDQATAPVPDIENDGTNLSPRNSIETMPSTSSDGTPERSNRGKGIGEEETKTDNQQSTPPEVLDSLSTPATGMHRRRGNRINNTDSSHMSTPEAVPFATAPRQRTFSLTSPYQIATTAQKSVVPRLSLFERAMGPLESTPSNKFSDVYGFLRPNNNTDEMINSSTKMDITPNTAISATNRRRWGAMQTPNCMMSPPIRSLTHGGSSSVVVKRTATRSRASTATFSVPEERGGDDEASQGGPRRPDPNSLRIEDIPSQVIPRGIAARTHGMLQFLSALKRGIVVRRHRRGKEPVFCKIVSNDGGDSIHFEYVETEDAMNAFKEQRVRYNRNSAGNAVTSRSIAQPWSYPEDSDEESAFQNHNFSVPDFIAAKQFREKMQRENGLSRKVKDVVTKVTRSGQFRASDMVAVHPARHEDPRSDKGELGTITLRRSKAEYSTQLSFSIVCRVAQRLPRASTKAIESFENKWYKGGGSDVQFRYLDFEAATEGEYWLIFRGFLLLHRDAAAGRFAAHRTAGIGSHVNRLELEQREQADLDNQNTLHRDEFFEPVTPSFIEKMIVKLRKMDTTFMEGDVMPGAVPPPSDFFLGFRSPGTQIWSRLRQAGLETHRVYNVDTRSVMIKVRCPEDRLMDVAEVLRIKLKTRQGTFAPFREDSIEQFQPMSEYNVEAQPYCTHAAALFRSSHRQTIIDFIIGSRIRDSGAELGQTTDLGKMILARTPLHVPRRLDNLYSAWCFFWRKENWLGRDGCSLRIERDGSLSEDNIQDSSERSEPSKSVLLEDHIPNGFYRFFIGSFFQPLDSIEEYFGEKVAFYFAWLQHCSSHLLVLTAAGLVVFACQLISQNWDHPIRPYFSIFIMLWSFTVLLNWRKRSNFLAYRWGTMDYKEQETTRPQFTGKYVVDEITQEWVVTYPKWKRWLKYLISFPLTLGFTFGSLIIILLFNSNRDLQMAQYMERKANGNLEEPFQVTFSLSAIGKTAPITDVKITNDLMTDPAFLMIAVGLPSVLGLSLPLLNFILMNVSYILNDFENYRTHSEYRTNLIIKVFSFRFVCYFASLYYYAFLSAGSKQAIENGIFRVSTGVLVYTTVAHWWTLFLQICFPLLIYKIRMRLRRKRLLKELAAVEMAEEELLNTPIADKESEDCKRKQLRLVNKRLLLDQAQDEMWLECLKPQHDSFPEYIQAVVQFAYVCAFSVVLPITPLIVLINYMGCMRLDAYKVCKVRRRPLSEKTGGIGVWEHLLHIVVVISVLTNCWLMGFTHSQFLWIGESLGTIALFGIVVCAEHVMLLIKYVMHSTCSTLPKSVSDEIRREQHVQAMQRNVTLQEKKRRSQFQKTASLRSQSIFDSAKSVTSAKSQTTYSVRWDMATDERTRMSEF